MPTQGLELKKAKIQKMSIWNSASKKTSHQENNQMLYNIKICTAFLLLITFLSIIIPITWPMRYYDTHLLFKNTAPCLNYLFGSDDLGRDMFVRIWVGTRISLFVGIVAALIDILIGVIYGAISALAGNKVDEKMMRICDIFYSIPRMLVIILFTTLLDKGIATIIIAMSITGWIPMARIIRAEILQIKNENFITHAKMIGASNFRLLFKYLLKNNLATIITTLTLTIPIAIFTEAFLSFLGLGVQAPIASLGTMAADGLSALSYYPWRLFFPAAFIVLIMLVCNVLGDSLHKYYKERS